MNRPIAPRRRPGFTLVEMAVVLVSLGVLAAFGVPRFVKSVERAKAAEACEYLSKVRASQERYQAQYGTYSVRLADLDITAAPPRDFSIPAVFVASPGGTSLQDSWSLTMTRAGSAAGYGAYTVTFTETGFDPTSGPLNISRLAAINPVGK